MEYAKTLQLPVIFITAMGTTEHKVKGLKMGAEDYLAKPVQMEELGVKTYTRVEEAIEGADVVMNLRIQLERQQEGNFPSLREYSEFFGLNEERLKYAKPDALVMHPGPINRGVELDSYMADHPKRSVILDQVYAGILTRMAALYLLLGGSEDGITA